MITIMAHHFNFLVLEDVQISDEAQLFSLLTFSTIVNS